MCIVVSVEEAFLERNYIQNTQHLHIWVGGEMGGLKFTTFGLPDIAENGSFLHCTSATKLWHPSVFALLLTYSSGKECWKELAAAAVFLAEKDKEKMLRNFSNVTEKKNHDSLHPVEDSSSWPEVMSKTSMWVKRVGR